MFVAVGHSLYLLGLGRPTGGYSQPLSESLAYETLAGGGTF